MAKKNKAVETEVASVDGITADSTPIDGLSESEVINQEQAKKEADAIFREYKKATELSLQLRAENEKLVEAIKAIYYAAHWEADREVDAATLWTNLRDAAKLEPGSSPTPIEKEVVVSGDAEPLRYALQEIQTARENHYDAARRINPGYAKGSDTHMREVMKVVNRVVPAALGTK